MQIEIRAARLQDITDFIALQEKYHVSNLTEEAQQTKGFVTMRLTEPQFEELVGKGNIFLAFSGSILAANAVSGDWAFCKQWAIIEKMESALPQFSLESAEFTIENSFQYGPVCIDEAFRGQNILTLLFNVIQAASALKYRYVVTFINQKNERSIRAHAQKTTLKPIGTFAFNENMYTALASENY
jgi:hypothetical protein